MFMQQYKFLQYLIKTKSQLTFTFMNQMQLSEQLRTAQSEISNQEITDDQHLNKQQFKPLIREQIQSFDRVLKSETDKNFKSQRKTSIKRKVIFSIFCVIFLYLLRNTIIYALIDGGVNFYWLPWRSNAQLNFVKLQSSSALCLDGSHAGYYLSGNGDPQKIAIFFEGGGWCGEITDKLTMQSCYGRIKHDAGGSSNNRKKRSITNDDGFFSIKENNYFKDWTKVYIIYCDGSGHQGSRRQPANYNDIDLYFRGHNNTVETFQDLEKKIGFFSKSSKIVVGGNSAGGLAALTWINYIVQRANNAKVLGLIDSGIFLDVQNIKSHSHDYRKKWINLMQVSNAEIDSPVPECIKDFRMQKYKCMFAQNIYKYVKAPFLSLQSVYDTYSIIMLLGIECSSQNHFQKCSKQQKNAIQQYRAKMSEVIKEMNKNKQNLCLSSQSPQHGLFGPSIYYMKGQMIEQPQRTINDIINQWLDKQFNKK